MPQANSGNAADGTLDGTTKRHCQKATMIERLECGLIEVPNIPLCLAKNSHF